MFSGWIRDFLEPHAQRLTVAHSKMLRPRVEFGNSYVVKAKIAFGDPGKTLSRCRFAERKSRSEGEISTFPLDFTYHGCPQFPRYRRAEPAEPAHLANIGVKEDLYSQEGLYWRKWIEAKEQEHENEST